MESLYKGFRIYRHNGESTVSAWLNGDCMQSGFKSNYKARQWVDLHLMRAACERYGPSNACEEHLNCCDCGGVDCGCAYCWSCHACDHCLNAE